MTISAAKVKSVCSDTEVALVRASRKGQLEKLSLPEVKRLANQARKQLDKWRDLGRSQSRAKTRKVGFGEADANTKVRKQIFKDALKSFEARQAKLEAAASPVKKAEKPKSKKQRAVKHRSKRSAVRKGMTAVKDLLNQGR